MIKLFRKVRQKMLIENKFSKYLLYATGEIVLVVIGILIALSINNWNEAGKERRKEINYLNNLKIDLGNELVNNENFRSIRYEKARTCSFLLNTKLPKTIENVKEYTNKYEQVFYMHLFVPNNNTFKELLSSGNLSLIKNDSIKNALLNLDKQYAEFYNAEHHIRREFEEYLYNIAIKGTSVLNFLDHNKSLGGFPIQLKIEDIPESNYAKLIEEAQWLYNNKTFNNGLRLARMTNDGLAYAHKNTQQDIKKMIKLINSEIEK